MAGAGWGEKWRTALLFLSPSNMSRPLTRGFVMKSPHARETATDGHDVENLTQRYQRIRSFCSVLNREQIGILGQEEGVLPDANPS